MDEARALKRSWRMALRRRLAVLLDEVLRPSMKRLTLGYALGVSEGLVIAWLNPEDADRKPLPAYAIALLPKEERARVLDALAKWGDEMDRGDALPEQTSGCPKSPSANVCRAPQDVR